MKKARLADVAQIIMGQAPIGESYNYEGKGLPLIAGAADLGDVNPVCKKFTTQPSKISRTGDIIMCIRATIGDLNWSDGKYALGRGVTGIRVGDKISKEYLWFWLLANKAYFLSLGKGATFLQINKKDIEDAEIPLPPLAEQIHIAQVLDQADRLRQQDRQLLAHYDQLVQAVFMDMFGDPVRNEMGWETHALSDVMKPGKIITYGIVQAGPHIENGVPYIKTGDIKKGKIITEGLNRTSREIADNYRRSAIATGDIVMSIRATVGTVAVVPEELNGANLTQGTARISPGADVTTEYLYHFLQTQFAQHWIQQQVKGATFREITLTKLRELPVLVPSIEQQQKFVMVVTNLEAQKAATQQLQARSETLFNSLLQQAFRGELKHPKPTAEPVAGQLAFALE